MACGYHWPGCGPPPASTDQAASASDQAAALAAAITPLAALIERLTAENRELAEAATVWQVRARHLEEQMKQLTAGDAREDAPQSTQEAPGDEPADVTDDAPRAVVAPVLALRSRGIVSLDPERESATRRVQGAPDQV